MATELVSHVPFLDIDIYRRLYSSLGHTVYGKMTHIDLSWNAKLHHTLANKHSMSATVAHRSKVIGVTKRVCLPGE